MHPELRARFNADFTPEKYATLLRCVNETEKWPADFRISETPVFLTQAFTDDVTRGANAIIDATRTPEFVKQAASAVPKGLEVPNESAHPNFLVVDFAICEEGNRLVPRLIELQAFQACSDFSYCSLVAFVRRIRSFRATGPRRLVESKTMRISNCYDAQSSPIRLRKMLCCWRSSRKNKKRESISPQQKHFLIFAPFA